MIKYFRVLRRKNDVTREQFAQHWKEIQGPLFVSKCNVPGLRKYIQNHPIDAGPEFEHDIDCLLEIWFDDVKSAQAFLQWSKTEDGKACVEDEKPFLDSERSPHLLSREHIVFDTKEQRARYLQPAA